MRRYIAYRIDRPLDIDGRLDKEPWTLAPWTDDFVDIEGDKKPAPRFRTRAKMLWDDHYFYIAAEMDEPHVWGTLTEHDSVIFQDNDFEVFIDPDGDNHLYGELEVNALNTTWDLLLPKPYRDGGPAICGWEIHGLKTAVKVDGTLNDPTNTDKGWSVEIAIPWSAMAEISGKLPCPPHEGDQWRVNFSRVEWHHEVVDGRYRKVPKTPEDNWVWSPQGVIDMHRPEHWGLVQFSRLDFGKAELSPYPGEIERARLMEIYYLQRSFHEKNQRWAASASELGIEDTVHVFATPTCYEAVLGEWHVDSTSRLWHGGYAPAPRPTWGVEY